MGSEAPLVRERLRELSGPELYRRNAFRVTGASTCAARRAIVRRRQQIAMAAKAGVAVGPAGELPLSAEAGPEELSTAFDVLDHPQRRIVDELFWFWDAPDASCPCVPELHRQHDEAVRAHARALDRELLPPGTDKRRTAGPKRPAGAPKHHPGGSKRHAGEPVEKLWQTAARMWRKLLGRDAVWAHLRHRVAALGDKRLTEAAVTVLEAEVRRVLVSAIAGLAPRTQHPTRMAQSCAQWTWAGRHLLGEALEEQLSPLYRSAEGELREAGDKLTGAFPERDRKTAATAAVGTLRTQVVPTVERLTAFADFGMSLGVGQLRDTTALLLNNCAVALSPASDTAPPARESLDLLDLALRLEPYPETQRTIGQNRARLDEANIWFSKAKPAFDPVVTALETASRQLDRNDALGAARLLEAAAPSLRKLRGLRHGALAMLPDVPEAVDRLSDSAAVLLNNCAIALASSTASAYDFRLPSAGDHGLRLMELAEEFCTTRESRVRIAANRMLLDGSRGAGLPYGISYGRPGAPVAYGRQRAPRKSLRTHLSEIYYGESPAATTVWAWVVVLLILTVVVVFFGT